jgi:hypothetical protein
MNYGFKERLRGATPEDLVAILNRESRNSGWGTARGFFLSALREAFLESGLDCSSFITGNNMRLIGAKLEGNKVVPVATAATPSAIPQVARHDDWDDQSLVDEVIRSLTDPHFQVPEALGQELAQRASGDYDEVGILRPFHEVEDDIDLLSRLLGLSAHRVEELEAGADLTALEMERFIKEVGEECFQADGTNSGWGVFGIVSSSLRQGFVAVTTSGGSTDGVERDFVGVYDSPAEAKAALQRRGYLDADDFRRRFLARRDPVEGRPVIIDFHHRPDESDDFDCPSAAGKPLPPGARYPGAVSAAPRPEDIKSSSPASGGDAPERGNVSPSPAPPRKRSTR